MISKSSEFPRISEIKEGAQCIVRLGIGTSATHDISHLPITELFCHCGKVFRTRRDLDWHKEGEHEKKPKKWNYCGE